MRRDDARGAVLLEVILALVLFVAAATVLSSAFSASMEGVDRRRRQLHAEDLAVTVMSEIRMGLRSPSSAGPEPFKKPFAAWTWQIVSSSGEDLPGESSVSAHVEVIIRHSESELVRRLFEWVEPAPAAQALNPEPAGGLP